MEDGAAREDRRRRYAEVLRLWEAENPIKTIKLQFLLLANGLLVPAFLAVERWVGPFQGAVTALVALMADVVWLQSIGRTVAYQKIRKLQLEALRAEDPDDPFLALHAPPRPELPWWGRRRASSYLIGAPLAFLALWAGLLIGSVVRMGR